MTARTQLQTIRAILKRKRRISRNQCLNMRITRLAARISDLKEAGWTFKTNRDEGDYVYRLISTK